MEPLRILFMGTPHFAVASLEVLIDSGYQIVAVVTAPDKPQGRGRKLVASPVKVCAQKHGIPLLQPINLKSPEFINDLYDYNANLQVVVAFRMLPEVVWSMPSKGTFNLHASLLPKYRGAAPVHWAVINGERETGVTTFFIKHEIDTGSIILQESEPIYQNDTTGSLTNRLMTSGAKLVLKTVQTIERDDYQLAPQDLNTELPKAPKLFKEHCLIDWNQHAAKIVNFVRGLNPFPTAWTEVGGIIYKIYQVEAIEEIEMQANKPGAYKTDGRSYLLFKSSDGVVSVNELQAPGKRKMSIEEFLRGNKL